MTRIKMSNELKTDGFIHLCNNNSVIDHNTKTIIHLGYNL